MRLMHFRRGGATGVAAIIGGEAFDLAPLGLTAPSAVARGGATQLALIAEAAGKLPVIDRADVEAIPFAEPGSKILCAGLNYADHAKEAGLEPPPFPVLFSRFYSSLVGAERPIIRPRLSDRLDFEGELAVVLAGGGRHISKADALQHVLGYAVFNDGSVRDYQTRTSQMLMGKNFDATGAMSAEVVTADELPAGASGLRITTRLNGQIVQDSDTSRMIFDVAALISSISEAIELAPGDIIVTGTPHGVGAARKPPLFMKHGDRCEVEIDGVGLLSNLVADEPEPGVVSA